MSEPFEDRLMRAIKRLGKTEAERAARLQCTVRAVDYWGEGKGLAARLALLEDLGVIRILDTPDQQPVAEQVAA